jgi:elongator complex protein 2
MLLIIGLWFAQESVGDAGLNHLGYYTGIWAPDGTAIIANGFTGALHLWTRSKSNNALTPKPSVTGHYGAVVDATWAVDGSCLLTVGIDQTARMLAKVRETTTDSSRHSLADDAKARNEEEKTHWIEVARPQVHGHDFSCIAAVTRNDQAESKTVYVSGSEEKVIRVFEAPDAFAQTLRLARREAETDPPAPSSSAAGFHASHNAYGATLPALGLSNKAVYAKTEEDIANNGSTAKQQQPGMTQGPDFAPTCAPSVVSGAALEEHLAQNTLWPEIHKLYGHGNDVFCVDADPKGEFVASACRAQSASTAGIFLWDAAKWTVCPGGPLEAHTLTVTQLAFSPDGSFLASASRDRSIAVFKRGGRGVAPPFALVSKVKAHARVVWSLDWSPDSQLLLTGSRDGSVKAWRMDLEKGVLQDDGATCTVKFNDSVRAVAMAPRSLKRSVDGRRRCLAAVGLENGQLVVAEVSWLGLHEIPEGERLKIGQENAEQVEHVTWKEVWRSRVYESHAAAVRRLRWRRVDVGDGKQAAGEEEHKEETCLHRYELASCGDDHAVRIFEMTCW